MIDRTVEIENTDNALMITAVISFSEYQDDANGMDQIFYEYESKYTQIVKVVDLESSGLGLIPINDDHYLMIEKYLETNDVMENL